MTESVAGRRETDLRGVIGGFAIAFALHDIEEILTAPSSGALAEGLAARLPRAAASRAHHIETTRVQMTVAVAVVGAAVAAITAAASRDSASPARTRGLRTFAHAVAVFGAHGVTHALQSLVAGTYAPGVASAPVVVVPYSVWALRRLRRSGMVEYREIPAMVVRGAAPAVALAATGHVVARLVTDRVLPSRTVGVLG